jgi:hypothetical protein
MRNGKGQSPKLVARTGPNPTDPAIPGKEILNMCSQMILRLD